VESLTQQLIEKARILMAEIETYGGMTAAIENGIPKMRIEESAAKKQAKIDSGVDTIVGVNKYLTDEISDIDVLSINNFEVLEAQKARLNQIKSTRNEEKVKESLAKIKAAASNTNENLLEYSVEAARNRATLGEISMAMEEVFGRYTATNRLVTGVFNKEMQDNDLYKKALALSNEFAEKHGRRPRIMVAKMGQDGHDRGAKVIATAFADLGFDVDISPLFQTPAEVAKQAIENDVHFLGISSLAGGHKSLIAQLIQELKNYEKDDIIIIAGGVIPQKDYEDLYKVGVKHIFGPGSIIAESAIDILSNFK
jgi:methylmalonyl-CoA mutase